MNQDQLSLPILKMIDLNASDVFLGMTLAFILCAILSRIVRIMTANAASDKNLPKTMIFLGTVVSLIMAVIGNSLARAFGAIGALSLIRFRTAVKSSNDLAYLFMAISVGMACGSGYFAIATGAAGLFSIFILIVEKFLNTDFVTNIAMLKIGFKNEIETRKNIFDVICENSITEKILSESTTAKGEQGEILVEITLGPDINSQDLAKKICDLSNDINVTILVE